MSDLKHTNIEIAKKVWELYHNGIDKSAIAKALSINRAEVTHIIKYTTSTLYLADNDFDKLLDTLRKENEILSKSLDELKYSKFDAYSNNEKTGEKLTYQRLVEIYENNIKTLKKEIDTQKSKYATFKIRSWVFFSIILFVTFLAGGFMKGYFMAQQDYRIIDLSSVWENQEGDTLYRLKKKN
jgi:hypothetical protein